MRLIVMARLARQLASRQLCRVGLHKWGRVREITSLDLRNVWPRPDGGTEIAFWATGERFGERCQRPACRRERAA